MGYRSDVKILMGTKAYELLKTTCLQSENEYVRAMVEKPSRLDIDSAAGHVLIGWEWYKWYDGYAEIDAVEHVLHKLDALVEEEPERYPLADYFYKKIRIGEDNETEESSNDPCEEYVCDFYVECRFSL